MTGIQQGCFRCKGCSPCGEDVIYQQDLHGRCMVADPEGDEVRQPLLTVQKVLAGAGPGALQ